MSDEASSPTKEEIEAVNGTTHEGPSDFSLENLKTHFEACLSEDGKSVYIDKYILGYDELYKFLNLLGTVFGWVATDVYAKLEIIRKHKNGSNGSHYDTDQSMIDYEIENKMIKPKAKDEPTGTRNLLRLHRALEYINAFLDSIPALEMADKCCTVSQEAYKKTLIKYHPWVVQKAAMLAMHMLPTKEGLIQKICDHTDENAFQKAKDDLEGAVAAMKKVYDVTQEAYSAKDLLALP